MRKPTICICKNKDADQLHGNRERILAYVYGVPSVFIIVVADVRYMKIHLTIQPKPSERVGPVDTASIAEPEGWGFESHMVFFS